MVNDSITYCLVRWFEPHDTFQRDDEHRPMCQGPLHINHCLWRYSKTDRPRAVIMDAESVNRQKILFGSTQRERVDLLAHVQHAYYGLITPNNIVNIAHMTPTFHPGTDKPNKKVWLQSVTII